MVSNLDSLPEIPTSPPTQIPENNGDSDGVDLDIILIVIVVCVVLIIVGLQIKESVQ